MLTKPLWSDLKVCRQVKEGKKTHMAFAFCDQIEGLVHSRFSRLQTSEITGIGRQILGRHVWELLAVTSTSLTCPHWLRTSTIGPPLVSLLVKACNLRVSLANEPRLTLTLFLWSTFALEINVFSHNFMHYSWSHQWVHWSSNWARLQSFQQQWVTGGFSPFKLGQAILSLLKSRFPHSPLSIGTQIAIVASKRTAKVNILIMVKKWLTQSLSLSEKNSRPERISPSKFFLLSFSRDWLSRQPDKCKTFAKPPHIVIWFACINAVHDVIVEIIKSNAEFTTKSKKSWCKRC